MRHLVTDELIALAMALAMGCGQSHVLGPGGEEGICCPVSDAVGCSGDLTSIRAGGWALDTSDCPLTGFSDGSVRLSPAIDAYGCPILVATADSSCLAQPDGGSPVGMNDAGQGGVACAELGQASCLAADRCIATYDDACCPSCTEGPCADCVDLVFYGCRTYAATCETTACSQSALGACDGDAVDCGDAFPTSADGCSVAGCVPAVGALPDPGEPSCVPVTAGSCRTSCLRPAPSCPEGTVPERDGGCYTDRCIPASVCD